LAIAAPSAGAPRISVVVVSSGRASLDAALASIAAQDYPDVDVVVAAANPEHPPVAGRLGAHQVRFLPAESTIGHAAAANRGLDAASGEWIGFLDDGDVYLPGHLRALMAAHSAAPDAGVVYSLARAVQPDGEVRRYGQPFSLAQHYAVSFIRLSTAIFRRSLVEKGCRFDETLALHYDWDMLLQIAQHTTFRFALHEGVQWDLAAAWEGSTEAEHDRMSKRYRDVVYAKWASRRDALIDQVEPMVRSAAEWSQHGDHLAAEACCVDVLAVSPNDPWALNLLAMIQRSTGRIAEARRTQELAVAVRPQDPALVFNLALLCRAQGDLELARRCCDQAIALDESFKPAVRLREVLLR
jgi:tetratricopeptide (TPR) repeat protein